MKKLVSLMLVLVMICSFSIVAFATTDYRNGTDVTYNPADPDGIPDSGDEVDLEAYTVTVPAVMLPGSEATVTASGTWASNRQLVVTADETVTLVNSISNADEKVLTVSFDGITKAGDNTAAVSATESIAVQEITNALFGTWSGHFNYEVEMQDVVNN